jgi:hypothetical protein
LAACISESEESDHDVSRPRPRRKDGGPEQPILPPSSAPKARPVAVPKPEQAAKNYIARRAKLSGVPGYVKLTFTLDMPRELAGRLSARAIREGKNLEAVVVELLTESMPGKHPTRRGP